MLIAFVFITLAYFLIFWQSSFRFIECTIACSADEYSKQLHAIIGTITYVLLVLQVLSGIFRPSIINPLRPYFNWLHTLNGFGIWAGASTNCILAITITKTGLGDNYGKIPNHVMMVTILVFVFTVAACEWFANSTRWHPRHPDAVEKLKEKEPNPDDEPSLLATVMIFFNASCGIAAATVLGIMLVNVMKEALK
uniref:Cytochrome b561 domain-containing protein n=1 Tax=Acrobeloides nanus TaxID=290746 RepID=A0A914E6E5_9BILA